MDIFALSFYAVICAVLGVVSPGLKGAPIRLVFGALVGVLAALSLPIARGLLG